MPACQFRRPPLIVALLGAFVLGIASLPASGSGAVLYDQMTGTPGGFVPANQAKKTTFVECDKSDPEGLGQQCAAADDFTVPSGPRWYVEGVHVEGRGGTDDRFSWYVAPGQGLPPAPFFVGGEGAFFGVYNAHAPAADSFDLPRGPSGGLPLDPGHYWLGVIAGRVAPWAWRSQLPVAGSEAAWENPTCGAWKHLSECGLPSADLRFRIEGTKIDRRFSAFKLSQRTRRPGGGVIMLGTFPSFGELTVRKISGKGSLEKCKCLVGLHGKSGFLGVVKMKPDAKTKAALKMGKHFKIKVAVTYKRIVYSGIQKLNDIPASTQILTLVLKKT